MTDPKGIPREVTQFITGYIDSVIELELLLLLHGLPTAARSAEDVARELRVDAGWVRTHLDKMTARGLLVRQEQAAPQYRFAPGAPELRQAVDALAAAYAERRVTVIGLIASKPIDTIRTFADAFRLRKDKPDG